MRISTEGKALLQVFMEEITLVVDGNNLIVTTANRAKEVNISFFETSSAVMYTVKEQIKIAYGKKIKFKQEDIVRNGHSIECRINAENPINFFPSSGNINTYHVPGGPGIRIDSALYTGLDISNYYDGLIAKLVIHGKDREECLMRLKRALLEFIIEGVDTTIPLYKNLIESKEFIKADYNINWLHENFL